MFARWGRFVYRLSRAVLALSALLDKKGDARPPVSKQLAGYLVQEVL